MEKDEQTATPVLQKGKKLFLSSTPAVSDPRFVDTLKVVILEISTEKPPVPQKSEAQRAHIIFGNYQ